MPARKNRGGAAKAAAKKPVPTRDTPFNDLKKAVDKTLGYANIADNDDGADEAATSSNNKFLDVASKELFHAARTFVTRPDDLQLEHLQQRATTFHLTDEQRLQVRKMWQQTQEALQRKSDDGGDPEAEDIPALDDFIQAFGLHTGAQQEETFWLPKKRTYLAESDAWKRAPVEDSDACCKSSTFGSVTEMVD